MKKKLLKWLTILGSIASILGITLVFIGQERSEKNYVNVGDGININGEDIEVDIDK
ncbi:MAG: hypothetical protein HRU19_29245 [Pseudobacteriovorax sp.]|nr:hypothetical protein [Pseudobacteriovorax sp.]